MPTEPFFSFFLFFLFCARALVWWRRVCVLRSGRTGLVTWKNLPSFKVHTYVCICVCVCVCVCVSEREGVDKKAARRVVDFVTPPGKKKVVGGWVPRWNVWGQQRVRTRLWRDKVVERTRCDSMCFFSCSLSSLKKKGSTHLSARFSSHLCVGGGVSARFELTPGLFRSSDKPAVHPMCVKGLRFLTVLCGLAASGENPPPTHPPSPRCGGAGGCTECEGTVFEQTSVCCSLYFVRLVSDCQVWFIQMYVLNFDFCCQLQCFEDSVSNAMIQ